LKDWDGKEERVGRSTSQKTLPVALRSSEGKVPVLKLFFVTPSPRKEYGVSHYTRGEVLIRLYEE